MKLSGLSIRLRLWILVLIFLIPYPILVLLLVAEQNRTIEFGEKEVQGAHYLRPVFSALLELSSGHSFKPDTWQTLEQMEQKYGQSLDTSTLYRDLRGKNGDRFGTFLGLNKRVGDQSNLILDPDLDSYYLMDIVLLRLPVLVQIDRAIQKEENLETQKVLFRSTIQDLQASLDSAFEANPRSRENLRNAVQEFMAVATIYMARPEEHHEELNQALAKFYTPVSLELERLLEARVGRFRNQQILLLIGIGGILLLAILTLIFVVRSIVRPLAAVVTRMTDVSEGQGDLTVRLNLEDRSELGKVAALFNQFAERLRDVISQIVGLGEGIAKNVKQSRQHIGLLSDGLQGEAAALEEISGTMEEISASTDQVSGALRSQANTLKDLNQRMEHMNQVTETIRGDIASGSDRAKDLVQSAEVGRTSLTEAGTTMEAIRASSDKMGGIGKIIQDIAERINLLSLNASIEAARAGEFGRGFTVVAEEVARLAEQTNQSIQNINLLIAQNNEQISGGALSIQESIGKSAELIEGIYSMGKHLSGIADLLPQQEEMQRRVLSGMSDLQEQSETIDRIRQEQKLAIVEATNTITSINDSAQVHANSSRELAETTESNEALAQELGRTVAFFTV
ncbi:MAG: HAMP domain-containing protein [Leptospiraceae bacterium]|nr:HAMP domain-containing protein [Leptospiraceae bacterium]